MWPCSPASWPAAGTACTACAEPPVRRWRGERRCRPHPLRARRVRWRLIPARELASRVWGGPHTEPSAQAHPEPRRSSLVAYRHSARASRPARQPWPLTGVESPPLPLASALLIPRKLTLLAEAHFEEDQEHGSGQSARNQHDREDFTHHSADHSGAHAAGEDQGSGPTKRQDAHARSHGGAQGSPGCGGVRSAQRRDHASRGARARSRLWPSAVSW